MDSRTRRSLNVFIVMVGLAATPILGDDAQIVSKPEKRTSLEAANERRAKRKSAEELLQQKPRLNKSGFLHDFWTSKQKTTFFSLKRPANAREDSANMAVPAGSERAKGVVLFSINF